MKDQSLEQTNQMGRFSQPPRPECCSGEGQARDPEMRSVTERPLRSVHKDKHGPQGGVATSLSNPASKLLDAGGDGVRSPQPNMKETVKGKVSDSLPGSKSVARVESDDRNLGGPETLPVPTTGTKREGEINDKKIAPKMIRESDRFIVARSKARAAPKRVKGPTTQRSLQRKPRP